MTPYARKLAVGRWLPALTLATCLLGCPQPPATPDSGTPVVDAGCSGVPGCECAAGACSQGECISGTCVACQRGEADCTCRSNNTCNAGLRCNATGLCETCPAGTTGCACGPGDTCGTGLLCSSGTCVADTCVAGSPACPCRASAPACDGAAYCDGMGLCQACSNDVLGCPCTSGACTGSTVCDTGTNLCRAPVTCADRLSAGACLPHQACAQVNGADAQCTPMTCEPQFKWDGSGCVACVTQDCAAEPSCADLNGGLGDTCASQNRACVQTGAAASCGACLSGFTGGLTGPCQPAPACGSAPCAPDKYCDRSGLTPTCLPLPCPVGQAQTTGGTCTACTRSCTGSGLSGRNWPFRTATDICVCETLDGYFFASSGGAPIACDADGDGWVREEADAPPIRAEPALRANARCNIQSVSRVRLVDEYRMSVEVLSCTEGLKKASLASPDGGVLNGGLGLFSDGGLVPGSNGAGACTGFVSLRLLETLANDVPNTPRGAAAPPYGARSLEAAELNSLTKACVTAGADFNDNAVEDMNEVQGTVAPTRLNAEADRLRLEQFAYFVELDSAAVENGVLVIRERSRCDASFPLRYDPSVSLDGGTPSPSDLYSLDNDKPYWRTCSRNRDPAYNATIATPGFDFAQWSCNEVQGGCANPPPPPHPTLTGPTDPSVLLMREHGLCRLNGLPPADGLWRGMSHHSQFKCVNVLAGAVSNPMPYDRYPADFGVDSNLLTFNQCTARPCATPGDPGCSLPQGSGAQTRQPVIDCVAVASPPSGSAGFAAVNYRPYRMYPAPGSETEYLGSPFFYQGGCVNEDDDAWQPYLCPYPDFSSIKDNTDRNFGRYSCYKYEPNFLWAGELPDGGSNVTFRSNLYWAPDVRNSVWGPRPPPDGGL